MSIYTAMVRLALKIGGVRCEPFPETSDERNVLQVGQQVRDRDIEDGIDDAIEAFFGYIWNVIRLHGWSIADRIFKITTWTMAVGAIQALHRQTEFESLQIIANILLVVLLSGIAVTVMNVMTFFQDQAAWKLQFLVSPGWRMLIMMGVSTLLIVLWFMLVLPAIVLSIDQVLSALSLETLNPGTRAIE